MYGFYNHRTTKMHLIHATNIVLLPKEDATTLADYRVISLINSLIKIIMNILAN